MLAEHAAIRGKIADLQNLLESGESLKETIVALGRLLHDHVRLEENVIFPRLEKTLTEDELLGVGRLLTRLHRRGESCPAQARDYSTRAPYAFDRARRSK